MSNKNYLGYQTYLRGSLGSLRERIDTIIRNNEQLEQNKVKLDKVKRIHRDYINYRNALYIIQQTAQTISDKLQEDRIKFLNNTITEKLKDIFPDDDFEAKLIFEKGRADTARLELHKSDGTISTPSVGQGQLKQYIISFSAIQSIVQGLGISNIFIDEAFGVAAEDKLQDLGEMVKDCVDQGMQVILISQNSALYNSIPHREIKLVKNYIDDESSIEEVLDY